MQNIPIMISISKISGNIWFAGLLIIFSGILAGCGDRPSGDMYDSYDMEEIPHQPAMPGRQAMHSGPERDAGTGSDVISDMKKVIKSGNIGLNVEDLENARLHIDSIVVYYGGYYANESFNDFDHQAMYHLTARVPSGNFEPFIEGIETAGYRITDKNISARDVTEEYIDLEMRLANRRRYLERYNELLKQAGTIKDIIDIEENTRKLEEEIESAEGRLKYLTGQVDYSILHITLTQDKEFRFRPSRRDGFFERLKQSLSGGWYGLIDFSLFIIRLWPFWIILILAVALFRRILRRRKK
jgi:hypothetical protein